jgi:drug/metabolite transporter (DMT)-like permease
MPLFTGVVGHFLLPQERLGAARFAGLLLGLGGIAVIHSADLAQFHPLAPVAALVVLIAPFVSAVATVLSKRASRTYSPFALAGIPMVYGSLVHVGLWLILERDRSLGWSWPGVGSIAYLTVVGSVVTFTGYFWLLRQVEVGRLNLLAYLTPLVALALGYFAAGETLTPRMAAGSALVLAGVAIANLRGRRAPAASSS